MDPVGSLRSRVCRDGLGNPRSLNGSTILGGADRDRTDDPLLAKQVLSQLSYSPNPMTGRPNQLSVGTGAWWA